MSPERKSKRRKSLDDMLSKGRKGLRETIDSAAHVTAGLKDEARKAAGKVQRQLGEDFYKVLESNPVVRHTVVREALLKDREELLSTLLNVEWTATALWSLAAGTAIAIPASH